MTGIEVLSGSQAIISKQKNTYIITQRRKAISVLQPQELQPTMEHQPEHKRLTQQDSNLIDDENDDDLLAGEENDEDLDDALVDEDDNDEPLDYEDSQDQKGKKKQHKEEEQQDPMSRYQKKQAEILAWLKSHPDEQWTDPEFAIGNKQFYKDPINLPRWANELKTVEWKRPQQIHKDPKFMLVDEDKNNVRYIDCDAKQGVISESWFIGALTILAGRTDYIEKLIVEKEYFDRGFVSFQFYKNGGWVQVVVDTLLPFEKDSNSRTSVYCSCANPQEFWISLMEKAYVKLHNNYETVCQGNILEGLVDMTGGVSEGLDFSTIEIKKQMENGGLWNLLQINFNQKFFIGCINQDEKKPIKNADQGQQGILENHYYSILDLRDFPKENLKLVRIRNPWGSDGVWNGAFCEDSDDWDKHRSLKQELKNVSKTKKTDGSWWMTFADWAQQFNKIYISKIFPESWENYSIEGKWFGKTNGGRCPPKSIFEPKEHLSQTISNPASTQVQLTQTQQQQPEYLQLETDDRWFNNPQYRIKVSKDTKMYISLMLEDEKLNINSPYIPCNFMVVRTKNRSERIWERPDDEDIVVESNPNGNISNQREVTEVLTLKKFQGKNQGIYMIIPNIVDKDQKKDDKKEEKRIFYLRIFASEPIDVMEMPETLEVTVEGGWNDNSAGGKRRLEGKDNPHWCKNPQYFLNFSQPTQMKIILRKGQAKKAKNWKVGMTICRFETGSKPIQKVDKKAKNTLGNNLQRLLQQTNEYLEPPIMERIERKLFVIPQQKFKESTYTNEDVSALYFKWNPTEGPFVIIPSVDGFDRSVGYKLTIFSNNPIELKRLDEQTNAVLIGKWEKDISAGGCHLSEQHKDASQRTWAQNPKYHLQFKFDDEKEEYLYSKTEKEPIAKVKITLAIAQKNWKKENPNTVGGMIGIYLLKKVEGKLAYKEEIVVQQTNFLPVTINTLECELPYDREISKAGYVIMPSTFQSKIHGTFILSVNSDKPFELNPLK